MRVKKFLARSLPEAMAQVKADLGPDAIILHTQPVRIGGIFGLFGQRMIEVTAAGAPGDRTAAPWARAAAAAAPAPALASPQPAAPSPAPSLSRLEEDVAELRGDLARMSSLMAQMLERMELPGNLRRLEDGLKECYATLVRRGVDRELAVGIARRASARVVSQEWSQQRAVEAVRDLIERDLGAPAPIGVAPGERRVVALVGPTGVGKTTTLAKLAARHALARRLKVAVLTADTYRIAAVEQLRVYCDIIGVPLEVVETPSDVAGALSRHRDKDLVLVDTAGRNPRSAQQMDELGRYLRALHPDETYLVVSLTASTADALSVAECFGQVGYDRLLLTKLDEAAAPGVAYNLAVRARRPLSYLTTGQNVPDDIEIAYPDRISRLLIGDAP